VQAEKARRRGLNAAGSWTLNALQSQKFGSAAWQGTRKGSGHFRIAANFDGADTSHALPWMRTEAFARHLLLAFLRRIRSRIRPEAP